LVGHGTRPDEALALHERFEVPRGFYRSDARFEVGKPLVQGATPDVELAGVRVDRFVTPLVNVAGHFRDAGTAVLRPKAGVPSRGAVVCIYPGSPKSGSVNRYAADTACTLAIQVFLSNGYTVVLADVLDLPTGTPIEGELVRSSVIVGSLVPQLYQAAFRGLIDIRKLVVMGHSQGALASVQAATSTPLFRGAIALSGVRYAPPKESMYWPMDGAVYLDGVHFTAGLEAVLENAPYYRATQITAPIFLAHGRIDVFPISASELMSDALRRAGKPFEFAAYESEGHEVEKWKVADREDLTKRVLGFLGRCLGEAR
jgi:dipeptidyl aminopeptidase/acylaminoacyl peptidase